MQNLPKITVLDGHTLNPGDLSWDAIKALGETAVYPRTFPDELLSRAEDAEVLLVNKVILDAGVLANLAKLKCIVVMATGFNNIDVQAARERNIVVCNARGYSAASVAQHVFALLLELTNHAGLHEQSVRHGEWRNIPDFSYTKTPILELAGKTMGIYGLGTIGKAVAKIALAFDMQVLSTHKHPVRDAMEGVHFVSIERLFSDSDVVSLHASMGPDNQGIVNRDLLQGMKPGAFLINTGRGGLINEGDLREALEHGWLAGAGLDVLSVEPPALGNPLIGLKNCIITPHIAWASLESRQRLMDITVANVKAYLDGNPVNVVNP